MSLSKTIQTDIKNSLRSGNKERLKVLRMISAAIKQKEVDERITLDETQVLAVLEKMLKQRRDSLSQYQAANRADLAEIEKKEIVIISEFMPASLTEQEVDSLIAQTIEATDASSMKDMGKIMGILKPKMQGRADMGEVSKKIRTILNS